MQHDNITVHTSVRDDLTRLEIDPVRYIKPLLYRLSFIYLAAIALYNLLQPINLSTAYAYSHLLIGLSLLLAMAHTKHHQQPLHIVFIIAFIALILSNGGIA